MNQLEEEDLRRLMEVIRHAVESDENGDSAFALQILTAVVEEFPQLGVGHSYLGWVLSRAGRHREAIEHGRAGVQRAPLSERSSLLLFRILLSADERDQAFNEMKRFLAVGESAEYALMLQAWDQEPEAGAAQ
jgi:predicted Zn-dependent protease